MATERWVYVKNGKLIHHVENDGYRFLRRGSESDDTPTSLEDLKNNPRLYEEALLSQYCVVNGMTCQGCKSKCPKIRG